MARKSRPVHWKLESHSVYGYNPFDSMDEPYRYRILIVEDNPGDVLLIEEAFKECGYRCKLALAASRAEAQKLLGSESFHLILADYASSDLDDSDTFIRMIRRDYPLTPVIAFSGYSDPRRAYEAGANAFVLKVGSLDEFCQKVRDTMRFWIDVATMPLPLSSDFTSM